MPTKEDFQGVSNCYVFKSRLQKYAQKAGLSTPVYETIKEGPLHEPSFRSTVMVNDVRYDSLPGFYNCKAAEHSAAEVALVELAKSGEVNQSIALLICHSTTIVFKSRLHEYAQKAGLSTPIYETIKEGPSHEPSFRSTVIVNNVRYDSLPGFFNRKAAEQSAAEVALVELAKSGVSNCYVSKSRLQEYAQKAGLSTPVYETIKEGPLHEPSFRSTVIVNDVRYDCLPGFFNRKAAEHSAAEVALVELAKSGEVNQSIAQPVAVIVEEENETVETVEAPAKMEPAEAETGMVDKSNNVVLQKLPAVIVEEENETVETAEAPEKMEPAEAETGMVDMSDNVVLRKLFRGSRYFDPPSDSSWGTCYNCGKEGHAALNCTAAKRQELCFVCGSLEHNVKKCPVGQYCHYCKGVGHWAKNCPVKQKGGSKSLTICLKCGNSGHDMFLCKNGYSQDDLKEMQCYVCKRFGHLCCVNTTDAIPREFSCYKCGQMGHTGLACSRLRTETTDSATPSSCYKCGGGGHFTRECSSSVKASSRWQPESTDAATPSSCYKCGEEAHFARECSSSVKASSRWHTETTDAATPSSCYKCGEEEHFARECSSSVKVGKRKREFSTKKTPRFQKENDYMGYRSAGLSTPVYETIKEGPSYEPSFRSTVIVNDVLYDSLPGFFSRKAAEQSAAEVALVELAKSGVSNCCVSKSRLQEYAQKAGLSTPVYETIKEGPLHEPSFRSTVIVNDVRYDCLPGFFNRKAAEHSAAEVALVELAKSGEVNQSIAQPVQETGLCKNLLQEYAQKMNYAMPMYHCKMDEAPGRTPLFSCTIGIGGVLYIGGTAKTKKEAEIKAARTALLAIQSNPSDASENQLGNNLTVIPCRKRARKSSKRKPSKDKIVRAIHADNVGIGANINHGVEESHANVNDESGVLEITSEAAFISEAMKNFEDEVSTNHQEKETLAGEHSFALNDQGIFETGKSTEFQPKEDNLGTVAIEVSSVPDGDNGEWASG